MRAVVLAAALLGCSSNTAPSSSCAPTDYQLCIIAEPPLPEFLWPWHCTDGILRGRAWCAVCEPAQSLYCPVDSAEMAVVCVPSCAQCQVPGWPSCSPAGAETNDMGIVDLSY